MKTWIKKIAGFGKNSKKKGSSGKLLEQGRKAFENTTKSSNQPNKNQKGVVAIEGDRNKQKIQMTG